MFRKILVANRGEIAVRLVRTCREMGIETVTVYEAADRDSLHARLGDECVLFDAPAGFMDREAILRLALEKGADAIHPGYGFLAEQPDFIRACHAVGITFIGPPAEVVDALGQKIETLERARAAGVATPAHSRGCYGADRWDELRAEADGLGYPLVVKSARGGRGRGESLARSAEQLEQAVRRAQAEAQAVYHDRSVYLEKAILPAHQVGVQVLGDRFGALVHLGEREGSVILGNQKIVEESPAPCLTPAQRERVQQTALELGRLFQYQSAGTVEFLVDGDGNAYFTEIKARIQMEQPLTEMRTRLDLVREQIRIAAGERLGLRQSDVNLQGCAMQCRVAAQDPWQNYMPSPGRLERVRLPGGAEVRVDTFIYSGCSVPGQYDPLIAKLMVWGRDRDECVRRMSAALREFLLTGTATNLPLLQRILREPDFVQGAYDTEFLKGLEVEAPEPPGDLRDLAAAAAMLFTGAAGSTGPTTPPQLGGWSRAARLRGTDR